MRTGLLRFFGFFLRPIRHVHRFSCSGLVSLDCSTSGGVGLCLGQGTRRCNHKIPPYPHPRFCNRVKGLPFISQTDSSAWVPTSAF